MTPRDALEMAAKVAEQCAAGVAIEIGSKEYILGCMTLQPAEAQRMTAIAIAASLRALAAQQPDGDEIGWVIELNGRYWDGRGAETFHYDHLNAVRFARHKDAWRVWGWIISDHIRKECKVTEHIWVDAPAAQQDTAAGIGRPVSREEALRISRETILRAEAERDEETAAGNGVRPCTCHPDDNPPVPCPQKYALSECRKAAAERCQSAVPDAYLVEYYEDRGGARRHCWQASLEPHEPTCFLPEDEGVTRTLIQAIPLWREQNDGAAQVVAVESSLSNLPHGRVATPASAPSSAVPRTDEEITAMIHDVAAASGFRQITAERDTSNERTKEITEAEPPPAQAPALAVTLPEEPDCIKCLRDRSDLYGEELAYIDALRRKYEEAVRQLNITRCPIGLDENDDICSASTCYVCTRKQMVWHREKRESVERQLALVLPMAKGYAAAHPVGSNGQIVKDAEAALAAAKEKTTK